MDKPENPDNLPVPHKADLQVITGPPSALDSVLSWFDRLQQTAIPSLVWLQCKLALAEGFNNAVDHAHKDMPATTEIKVEVVIYVDRLEIKVWDRGHNFDLEQKLKDLPEQVDTYAPRGRGLKLMQAIADQLTYDRYDDRNCLSMVKYYAEHD